MWAITSILQTDKPAQGRTATLLQHHFSAPCTHNPHVLHLHFRATAITIRSTEIIPCMFFTTVGTNLHSVLLNPVSAHHRRNIGGRAIEHLIKHNGICVMFPLAFGRVRYIILNACNQISAINVFSHYSGNTSVHALTRIFASHCSSSISGKNHLPPR